jgi:quinol monooxygenase YgiN
MYSGVTFWERRKGAMHIQIINFNLKGASEADYSRLCNELAPSFAALPGLVSKVWLADPETNTFGGVYTWRDRQAMESFTKTELFNAVATHPNLTNITSKDFAVMEEPTRVTRGLIEAGV